MGRRVQCKVQPQDPTYIHLRVMVGAQLDVNKELRKMAFKVACAAVPAAFDWEGAEVVGWDGAEVDAMGEPVPMSLTTEDLRKYVGGLAEKAKAKAEHDNLKRKQKRQASLLQASEDEVLQPPPSHQAEEQGSVEMTAAQIRQEDLTNNATWCPEQKIVALRLADEGDGEDLGVIYVKFEEAYASDP